jgi:hypothetical protein
MKLNMFVFDPRPPFIRRLYNNTYYHPEKKKKKKKKKFSPNYMKETI